MKAVHIFPFALIVLDIGAAIVYGVSGDFKRCGYWVAAGAITFFATI